MAPKPSKGGPKAPGTKSVPTKGATTTKTQPTTIKGPTTIIKGTPGTQFNSEEKHPFVEPYREGSKFAPGQQKGVRAQGAAGTYQTANQANQGVAPSDNSIQGNRDIRTQESESYQETVPKQGDRPTPDFAAPYFQSATTGEGYSSANAIPTPYAPYAAPGSLPYNKITGEQGLPIKPQPMPTAEEQMQQQAQTAESISNASIAATENANITPSTSATSSSNPSQTAHKTGIYAYNATNPIMRTYLKPNSPLLSSGKYLPVNPEDEALIQFGQQNPTNLTPGVQQTQQATQQQAEQNTASATNTILEQWSSGSTATMLNTFLDAVDDPTSSSASILKGLLQSELELADNSKTMTLLMNMEARAQQAYEATIDNVDKAQEEIDAIISGEDVAVTTAEGLMAKIYQNAKDYNASSIELQEEYLSDQYDQAYSQALSYNSQLEGYMKAKLYAMGAQDSSAGLQLLAGVMNQAQMRLQSMTNEYNYNMASLAIEDRKVMNDYTNSVIGVVQELEGKKSEAYSTYQDKLDEIDASRIASESEKNEKTLAAYKDYYAEYTKLEQESYDRQQTELENARNAMNDNWDRAYKLSGLTGTVWYADEEGNILDSGVSTYDATTQQQQLELSQDDNRRQWATMMLNTYGSSAASSVEQLLGLESGSLTGLQTIEEQKMALDNYWHEQDLAFDYANAQQDGLKDASLSTLMNLYGTSSVSDMQGIDASLSDVASDVESTLYSFRDQGLISQITQQQLDPGSGGTDIGGGHNGWDVTWADGKVKSLTEGTVVGSGYDDAYGNYIMVQDSSGRTWKYSHFADSNFSVDYGDVVSAGDELGTMGSTGRSTGAHTDIRLVGYDSASTTTGTGGIEDTTNSFLSVLQAWRGGQHAGLADAVQQAIRLDEVGFSGDGEYANAGVQRYVDKYLSTEEKEIFDYYYQQYTQEYIPSMIANELETVLSAPSTIQESQVGTGLLTPGDRTLYMTGNYESQLKDKLTELYTRIYGEEGVSWNESDMLSEWASYIDRAKQLDNSNAW